MYQIEPNTIESSLSVILIGKSQKCTLISSVGGGVKTRPGPQAIFYRQTSWIPWLLEVFFCGPPQENKWNERQPDQKHGRTLDGKPKGETGQSEPVLILEAAAVHFHRLRCNGGAPAPAS